MDELDSVFPLEGQPEEVVQQEPEIVVEQVAEPQPEASPEVVEPVAEPEKRDDHVPLAKYLDQRDELKELRRWKQDQESRQQPQRAAPDFYDMKPEEAAAYIERVADEKATQTRFMMSESWAKKNHGAETVETATAWATEKAATDPTFVAQYMSDPDPVDFIVRQHRRESIVSKLPDDISSLDELVEREIARRAGAVQQVATPVSQPTVTAPKAPPRSLVNAPSHGGVSETPVGKLAGFDTVFPG